MSVREAALLVAGILRTEAGCSRVADGVSTGWR